MAIVLKGRETSTLVPVQLSVWMLLLIRGEPQQRLEEDYVLDASIRGIYKPLTKGVTFISYRL
jgi:hypothetical protein